MSRLSRITRAPSFPNSFHRRSSAVSVLFALSALARQLAPCEIGNVHFDGGQQSSFADDYGR